MVKYHLRKFIILPQWASLLMGLILEPLMGLEIRSGVFAIILTLAIVDFS